jgi:hypothetical protein
LGWFSPDLFGGDTPMDVLSAIGEAIGEQDLYPLSLSPRRRTAIRRNLEVQGERLIDLVLSDKFICQMTEPDVSLPVLAACYLATGAAMPERLRIEAADAARRDPISAPDTTWIAGTDDRQGWPERRAYMAALAVAIEDHRPGEVFVSLGHVGLMERMAGRMPKPGEQDGPPALSGHRR